MGKIGVTSFITVSAACRTGHRPLQCSNGAQESQACVFDISGDRRFRQRQRSRRNELPSHGPPEPATTAKQVSSVSKQARIQPSKAMEKRLRPTCWRQKHPAK